MSVAMPVARFQVVQTKLAVANGVPTKLDLESEVSKYRIAIGVPRKSDRETKGSL